MADNKEIKFSFVVDQASAQSVMRTLKDLTDQAEKFAKALQGAAGAMSGGGGGGSSFFGGGTVGGKAQGPSSTVVKNAGKGGAGGTSAITNVVLENAKAFKGMASMSGDALKSMTDILKRSVEDQKKSIGDLDKTIEQLGNKYQALKRKQQEAMNSGSQADQAFATRMIRETSDDLAKAQGGKLKAQQDLKSMPGEGGPGPATSNWGRLKEAYSEGGGGMGGMLKAGNMNLGAPAWAGAVMRAGGMILAGAQAAFTEVREGEGGTDLRQNARRGRLVNGKVDSLRGGDISQLIIQDDISKNKEVNDYYKQQTDASAAAVAYGEGAQSAIGKLPVIKQALGLFGKEGAEGSIAEQLTTSEIQSKLYENMQGVENKQAESAATHEKLMAYQGWAGSQGSRNNARRVMGLTLMGKDGKGSVKGSYGELNSWAESEGLSGDSVTGNFASIRNMGGNKLAGQLAKYETLSQAGGYSGFSQMAARANMGAGSAEQAQYLARSALGGGVQTGVGMEIGNQVFGYNSLGTTSGAGMLGAIQNGMNWKGMSEGEQFARAQSIPGAMNMLNSVMRGTLDNETRGTSTLSAKKILADGGGVTNTRAVDYLGTGMDLKQMMDIGYGHKDAKGKIVHDKKTDEMEVYKITQSDVRKQASAKLQSLFKSQLSDEATRPGVSKFISALEGGVTPAGAMKSLSADERKQVNVALRNRTGAGGEEAKTANDLISQMTLNPKALKQGDALGAGLTGPEAEAAKAKAKEAKDAEQRVKEMEANGGLSEKIKNANAAAKAQQSFGTNLGAEAEVVAVKLAALATAIQTATDRINGKPGQQPKKATAEGKK